MMAKQAAGSCLVQFGETVVITAVTSGPPRQGGDFFPLTCDYRERTAAAGKFPGGFLKREGRPTMKETLTSRLMDRPIRPLFPAGFFDEVQIQSFVLASDRQTDGDVLAMNGAAAALGLSPLPFQGPIASVRLGHIGNRFVPFPTQDELEESDLDLIVSGSKGAVLMIEGFAREMPEDLMAEAIAECQRIIREICALQEELFTKAGVQKPESRRRRRAASMSISRPAITTPSRPPSRLRASKPERRRQGAQGKGARRDCARSRRSGGEFADSGRSGRVRQRLASSGRTRRSRFDPRRHASDGRSTKALRSIECHVDVLPRVHGSAMFQRGETQALITVTLGTPRDEQRVDGLIEEYSKKFMLDYYFPPFSVGETKPIRGPGRREIGHGALAERSIKPVLPDPDEFPYTIRVISDILESNGSSSMASVCGGTLGLMAAGVPISNPVAGISVGLVKESDSQWVLLTDIIGDEDHFGDMDFKIAGTQKGITGIQLDLKIDGISPEIIQATMAQSREARIEILRKMLTTIMRPRSDISPWAPRLLRTQIDPEKIGALIGPGGKMIRSIQETTGAVIEVDDDGTVTIASTDAEGAKAALAKVEAITASVQIGRIYEGRVTSVKDFGAFVEILPGKDGLCHISELSDEYVHSVGDVCKVGDLMHVKVIAIDDQERVKLSRKQALREMATAGDGK